MHFTPTEIELAVMRALDTHPWYPAPAIAQAAGLEDDVDRVRSALSELRRFHLVESDGRLGGGRAGRYCLTHAGAAVVVDTVRRRCLESSREIAVAAWEATAA
jgi:hypothetical protein